MGMGTVLNADWGCNKWGLGLYEMGTRIVLNGDSECMK
jgi:hypothetical protein